MNKPDCMKLIRKELLAKGLSVRRYAASGRWATVTSEDYAIYVDCSDNDTMKTAIAVVQSIGLNVSLAMYGPYGPSFKISEWSKPAPKAVLDESTQ